MLGCILAAAAIAGGPHSLFVTPGTPNWVNDPPGPLPIPPKRQQELEAETISKAQARREKREQRRAADKMRTLIQQSSVASIKKALEKAEQAPKLVTIDYSTNIKP